MTVMASPFFPLATLIHGLLLALGPIQIRADISMLEKMHWSELTLTAVVLCLNQFCDFLTEIR